MSDTDIDTSDEECAIAWAGAILDIEKIVALTTSCDKDCKSCTQVERMDCHLEMREAVHSLAVIFKQYILGNMEAAKNKKDLPPPPEKPNGMFS
jgi:hypothetical protein